MGLIIRKVALVCTGNENCFPNYKRQFYFSHVSQIQNREKSLFCKLFHQSLPGGQEKTTVA